MNMLLDTHAFIWFLNGDARLPGFVKDLISDTSNKCFLSIGSIWEIAIKVSLKKIELKGAFSDIADFIASNEIEVLPITFDHVQRLLHLKFYHRDPFDRIIIAQSLTENLTVITKDDIFRQYNVSIIWS